MTMTTLQVYGTKQGSGAAPQKQNGSGKADFNGASFSQILMAQMPSNTLSGSSLAGKPASINAESKISSTENRMREQREIEQRQESEKKRQNASVAYGMANQPVVSENRESSSKAIESTMEETEASSQKQGALSRSEAQAKPDASSKEGSSKTASSEETQVTSQNQSAKAIASQADANAAGQGEAPLEEGLDFVRIYQDAQGVAKVSPKTLAGMEGDLSALKDLQLPEEFASLIDTTAKIRHGLGAAAKGLEGFAGQDVLDNANDSAWLAKTFDSMALANTASSQSKNFSDLMGSGFNAQSILSSLTAEVPEDAQTFDEWLDGKIGSLSGVSAGFSVPKEGIATSSAMPTTTIREALGDKQWTDALGNRVEWLVSQKIQKATILVNPANLGPIEVSISVEGGKTHALFVTQNPQVREAIESSLPRLEQMLANVGVALGEANVSGDNFSGQGTEGNGQQRGTTTAVSGKQDIADASSYISPLGTPSGSRGFLGETMQLVDTFV